ncbi:MAG TPA: alpha-glucan family phosphorylase, partial [Vicinamibacteria bacterium]
MEIRTLHTADIELPPSLERLRELAYDLWWSWSPLATRLFAWIDPEHWRRYHNPVQLLINIEPQQWMRLLSDPEFRRTYEHVILALDEYRARPRWFDQDGRLLPGPVAYFSMEFGIHESLGVYSGGLGVLAGDHCKAASDLGVPLVGVGLLYRSGYFRQTVDADGYQQHIYPDYDFARLPVQPVQAPGGGVLTVPIDLPGRIVQAAVWKAQVGLVPVLMLDTDIPLNDPADRPITGVLYVRGREMRLCQEIVLGVGGVRALSALGIHPAVWHMNEGHVAFLNLERVR